MIRVAVVGLGSMGMRRAAIADACPDSEVVQVYDISKDLTREAAARFSAYPCASWEACVAAQETDVVVVSTPNVVKDVITACALRAGKAVLAEKPPPRDPRSLADIMSALDTGGGALKVGFNYRYFRGLQAAMKTIAAQEIGQVINYRLRHGHGGRPDYAKDWRLDPAASGGGDLIDQGSHVLDIATWLAGPVTKNSCVLQCGAWGNSELEDNAFITLCHDDVVGQLHVSWTSWKNEFSLNVFGTRGSVVVNGLGGSYGPQSMTTFLRDRGGGPPTERREEYPLENARLSLEREWHDFLGAIRSTVDDQWREQAMLCGDLIAHLYAVGDRVACAEVGHYPGSVHLTSDDQKCLRYIGVFTELDASNPTRLTGHS